MSASTTKVKIDDGIYNAIWKSYNLTILSNDNTELITIKSIMGIRGDTQNERVEVKNGIVSFYYK